MVSDNVVVQWCLLAAFILILGTNVAAKMKGPIGVLARWIRELGRQREEREAKERRENRQKLLGDREFVTQKLAELERQVAELFEDRDKLGRLIREHMGWDFDRTQQLIGMGVRPGDIPTPPPLRVPWGTPEREGRHRVNGTDTAEQVAVR
jgi:hypothetical protein